MCSLYPLDYPNMSIYNVEALFGFKKSAVVPCEIILTHVSACDSNLQIFLQRRAFENKEN